MTDAPSPSEATQPQSTPRVRRRRDQSDQPVGPDEVINVHNVHRLVMHEMIMSVFPEEIMINGNPRDFKEDARRGRIRMMIDCTSDAMVDVVSEEYPVYMRADYEKKGLPARGKGTEFALIFVKLLYARGVLGRTVDFSRLPADESGSTPRRVRPRYTITTVPLTTPSGDGGGNAIGSQAPIVPFGEGPSSQSSNQRSWLGPPDRDAILNWIDSGPFILVDRRAHEAARLRLAETDPEEDRLRSQLAQARDAEKAAEQALHLSSTAVGELTVRVSSAELRIAFLSEEITEKDARIRELEVELIGVNEDLAVERADRADLIYQLDEARAAAGWDPEVVGDNGAGTSHAVAGTSNAQAGTSNAQAGTSNAQAQADGPPLTEDQKLVINLQAQIAGLNERLGAAEEALEIERRRNFADGSERAAWESEKTILERRLKICSQERDNAIRVYEERHSTLQQECARQMQRLSPDELRPNALKSAWEILRKYDASLHSLAAAHTMMHQLVTKKFKSRHYDPVQLEGVDLKMVVVRGQKSMWPPGKWEEWNAANNVGDLYKICRFFPGWAPLLETQGGTIGLSPIWHQAQCQLCQDFFGPEGGYLHGSCSHPIHIHCLVKLMGATTHCGYCRAPYHSRMYGRLYATGQPLFARLEHIDRFKERAERDFANPEDMTPTYHLRERAIELMYYYLCPSRASPGTYAEYGEDVYEVVPSNWPPECFNFKKHFQGALVELHGGTANPQQAHSRAPDPPAPRIVLSDTDTEGDP
ncbi:hypothetical protein R1sor_014498 [Riccia sorocarpa]|uniref:RING-type domain-containing protein n=1 Tax=Riccia sorocarpa TaxID=122646 RepID=A0ABD3HFP5_9MARC